MQVIGEEFLHLADERNHQGDVERTALRLLAEFRAGDIGKLALKAPAKP